MLKKTILTLSMCALLLSGNFTLSIPEAQAGKLKRYDNRIERKEKRFDRRMKRADRALANGNAAKADRKMDRAARTDKRQEKLIDKRVAYKKRLEDLKARKDAMNADHNNQYNEYLQNK